MFSPLFVLFRGKKYNQPAQDFMTDDFDFINTTEIMSSRPG